MFVFWYEQTNQAFNPGLHCLVLIWVLTVIWNTNYIFHISSYTYIIIHVTIALFLIKLLGSLCTVWSAIAKPLVGIMIPDFKKSSFLRKHSHQGVQPAINFAPWLLSSCVQYRVSSHARWRLFLIINSNVRARDKFVTPCFSSVDTGIDPHAAPQYHFSGGGGGGGIFTNVQHRLVNNTTNIAHCDEYRRNMGFPFLSSRQFTPFDNFSCVIGYTAWASCSF